MSTAIVERAGRPVATERDAIPVLYADASAALGGASVCLAEMLHRLQGIRPIVQHALPPDLANFYEPWETAEAPPWNAESYVTWADPHARPSQSLPAKAWRLSRRMWQQVVPAARRTAALARRHGARLIHCNNCIASNLPDVLAARWLGIPCIVHGRGFEPPSRLVKACAGFVTQHVVMSRVLADQLVEWGAPRDKVHVIYDGIDVETIRPPRPPATDVVVGVVGRFVHWKGMHVALDAALHVVNDCPHVRFQFVGGRAVEAPAYYDRLRQKAAESPHSRRLEFVGEHRDAATTLMPGMDILMLASIEPEPFGRVLTEAMAAGCAVIATNHGGPVEICAEGAGVLVPPNDATALAAAVTALVMNPMRRYDTQQRGQDRLRAAFDLESTARQMEALYATCLA